MPKETEKAGLKVDFSKAIKDALFLLCSSLSWYGCFLGAASWWWGWNKGWIFYFSSWNNMLRNWLPRLLNLSKSMTLQLLRWWFFHWAGIWNWEDWFSGGGLGYLFSCWKGFIWWPPDQVQGPGDWNLQRMTSEIQSSIWAFVFNVCRRVRLEGCYQLVVFPWFLVLMLILFCFVLVDLSSWTIKVELFSITCIVWICD